MKKQRKVYYGKAVYGREEINAVLKILKNKSLSLMDGDNVKLLEKKVSRLFGKKFGLMVNSGSSANLLGLAALNLKKERNYYSLFNLLNYCCTNISVRFNSAFYRR